MLNLKGEFTHERLAIRGNCKPNSTDAIDVLSGEFIRPGVLGPIRSDHVLEFIATAVTEWTAFIEPGSHRGNGHCESFSSKLRDTLLDGEISRSLAEARIFIEARRQH